MKKNPYETRNKAVKIFTIIVIIAFLLTIIAGGIVSFLPANSDKKQSVINTVNKPLEKENQEVNNSNNAPWQLIQTGNIQK